MALARDARRRGQGMLRRLAVGGAIGLGIVYSGVGWGCGGSEAASPPAGSPTVAVPASRLEGPESVVHSDPSSCVEIERVPLQPAPAQKWTAKQRAALDRRIEAAHKAVQDSMFRDVDALVEIGRLQLLRGSSTADDTGQNDLERGRRNAMRAVAVDDSNAAARLVLALVLSSTVAQSSALREPHSRAVALGLVSLASQHTPPEASNEVLAAEQVLRGVSALDAGRLAVAAKAFEVALERDPQAAGAWAGRGHLARSRKDLSAAQGAYRRALDLAPEHLPCQLGLEATTRCEALLLPEPISKAVALPSISPGPLASAPAPAGPCTRAELGDARSKKLCGGRQALRAARSPDEQRKAAGMIIAGWGGLRSACESQDPICGSYVSAALLEASQAFRAVGPLAKSVATARLLIGDHPVGPQPPARQAQALLVIGDSYFRLGVFDQAAAFYERHASHARSAATVLPARERAMVLRVALGQAHAATKLAGELARDKKLAVPRRAAAVLIAAELLRASSGPAAAKGWLAPHRSLLDSAGLGAQAARLSASTVADPPGAALLLPGAVRQLLADSRWSPAAQRIADSAPAP